MQYDFLIASLWVGFLSTVASGMGVVPLALGLDIRKHVGLGYGFSAGLMMVAALYNLVLPTVSAHGSVHFEDILLILVGVGLGVAAFWFVSKNVGHGHGGHLVERLGGRRAVLIFLALAFHRIPEGVAVGVGFASDLHLHHHAGWLGNFIAMAIIIHNIPEGLAVAIPLCAGGMSIRRCFAVAFLTSLPQPLASIPAALLVWFFAPIMLPLLGFAAGAILFLVVTEVIPEAVTHQGWHRVAWATLAGGSMMFSFQAFL